MNTWRYLVCLTLTWLLWQTPARADIPKPHIDLLGDPLPPQALHRFGTARLCTEAEVTSLAMTGDGKILAAADRLGHVYVWDALTGKQRLRTNAGSGKRVVISPDGQWLALGDEFPFEVRNLRLNDTPRLQFAASARVFTFSPDSKSLATNQPEESDIFVYDLQTGKEQRRFAGLEGMAAGVAFSPDGKLFAGAAIAGAGEGEKPSINIVVWDAMSGEKRKEWTFAARQLQRLQFLPDNQTLVGLFTSRLAAWDATTGNRLVKLNHEVGSSFALDEAGKILATTIGPSVLEFPSGKEIHEFESPAQVRHLAMSADGKLLAASPARFDIGSPRILLWDLTTGKERLIADGQHRHYVDAVAYSHDGKMIATASNIEGMARVWDAKSSKLIHTLRLDSVAAKRSGGPHSRRSLHEALAFSIDRPELFISGQRWDLLKGEPIPLPDDDDGEFRFEQTNSYRAVLTPDARRAASYLSDHSILFWDPAKAKAIRKIDLDKKTRGEWFAFAFTPDGKHAATGRWFPLRREGDETPPEDTIYLWDIAAGKRIKTMRQSDWPVVRLMLAQDGETLAVIAFPTKLELWHLPTGRLLREMILADLEEMPKTLSFGTVAFAPHGQWIAFTHQEGEILLLETLTGKTIQTLQGHQGFISSLAFSPDNRRLLSGGRDTTALLWSIVPPKPAQPKTWSDTEKLWQGLGGPPDQAYPIVWALMANPARAMEVLSKRLQPDGGATEKEIRELIANLSSEKFAQRDVAMRRLKEIGTRSLPALEQALKKAPDLETGRRIRELLKTVERTLTPEMLCDMRGLQILEMIGSPAARQLLGEIARGDAAAGKTRLAQAALERLKRTDAAR